MCGGCSKRPTCRTPCAEAEAQLPQLTTDWHSAPLIEDRLRLPDQGEDDEEGPWARFVEQAGPRLVSLSRRLPGRERFVLVAPLAGHSSESIARALGLSPRSLGTVRRKALALLRRQVRRGLVFERGMSSEEAPDDLTEAGIDPHEPSGQASLPDVGKPTLPPARIRCAERYCCRSVELRVSDPVELQAFCKEHRRVNPEPNAPSCNRFDALAHERQASEAELSLVERLCAPSASPCAQFIDVTPGLALAILRRGVWTGWLSGERISLYAADMREGAWRITSQGIGIGKDGKLCDGRHRLWAIIQANVTVNMPVITGLDAESREALDSGRLRSIGETIHLVDGEPRGKRIVPWVRAINVLHGQRPRTGSVHTTRQQIASLRRSLDWMLEHGPKDRRLDRPAIVGSLVYAHSVVGDRLEPFLRDYVQGENLSVGDPARSLRDYVTERMGAVPERDRAPHLRTLRAVRAFLENEPLDRLRTSESGYRYLRALEAARTKATISTMS